MMTINVAPPNSLILISDRVGGMVPEFEPGKLVLATSSVVSVGCLANVDGETKIILGTADRVPSLEFLVYDGALNTPSRAVVVRTSEGDDLLEDGVHRQMTRIRIWVNRAVEPDQIIIGWS